MLGARLRLNIHARIAILFFTGHLPVLAILYEGDFDPKIQHGVALFVFCLTAAILLTPYVWQYAPIRRLFYWVDVLTTEEKELLLNFDLRKYRDFKRSRDYVDRTTPFLQRIVVLGIALCLIGESIESDLSMLCVALAFYLFVLLLIIAASMLLLAQTGGK